MAENVWRSDVVFQHLENLVEVILGQSIKRIFTVASYGENVFVFQNTKMVRRNRLLNVEPCVYLADGHRFAFMQHLDDQQADGVCNGPQGFGGIFQKL